MIIIIDFGSQTTHLIKRRLLQIGVESLIIPPENSLTTIKEHRPKGIIFSGSPYSVYEPNAPTIDPQILQQNIPLLGICFGWQIIAKILGTNISTTSKEYGPETLCPQKMDGIFSQTKKQFTVWMSHGDSVSSLPQGFTTIASTHKVPFAAVANKEQKIYGVQFHPEADHTEFGMQIINNFAIDICGQERKQSRLNPEEMITKIRQQVGKQKVIGAVSGGVDSTVAAALIGKAIQQQFIPIYIDSGLMRPGTKEHVQYLFTELIPADVKVIDAKKRFMSALKGITDPEEKRKTIGKLYIDIFQEEAQKYPLATFLAQGTIYSDVIESKGSQKASNIKSHHNVGGLPQNMKLSLLEPLREYYKDEVRQIGTMIGLPPHCVMMQPFPGPGFAVRIRGEVTEQRLLQVQQADSIIIEEMQKAKIYDKLFQCFAVMTGAFSTAVKGDARVFAEVVALRAYESKDVMSSTWAKIPYEVLQNISSRIVNEVFHVSRVVYDITTKPPATMEWE